MSRKNPDYTQDVINKVHHLKASGTKPRHISKEIGMPVNKVNYILYKRAPEPEFASGIQKDLEKWAEKSSMKKVNDEVDDAIKNADTILGRIKKLMFG